MLLLCSAIQKYSIQVVWLIAAALVGNIVYSIYMIYHIHGAFFPFSLAGYGWRDDALLSLLGFPITGLCWDFINTYAVNRYEAIKEARERARKAEEALERARLEVQAHIPLDDLNTRIQRVLERIIAGYETRAATQNVQVLPPNRNNDIFPAYTAHLGEPYPIEETYIANPVREI